MSREEPNEFTVLLKIVEVIDVSLQNSTSNSRDPEIHAKLVNIISALDPARAVDSVTAGIPVVRQDIIIGDQYTVGQAGAVGPNSRAISTSFDNIWERCEPVIDIHVLAAELSLLRDEIGRLVARPEDDLVLAEVTKA